MNKAVLAIAVFCASPVCAQTVKDYVEVSGADSNPLTGWGVVIGLNGKGDAPKGPTATRLTNLLKYYSSVDTVADTINAKNAALVAVTAELPPFAKEGGTIDVHVSAVGDGSSIIGGTLMVTDLWSIRGQAKDEKRYAAARGRIVSQGDAKTGNPSAGYVPNGGTIFRVDKPKFVESVAHTLRDRLFSDDVGSRITIRDDRGMALPESENPTVRSAVFRLRLRQTDVSTASALAAEINKWGLAMTRGTVTKLGFKVARAVDGGMIEVIIPSKYIWEMVKGPNTYPTPGYDVDPISWMDYILSHNVAFAASPRAVVTINDVQKGITWTDGVRVLPGQVRLNSGAVLSIPQEMPLGQAMKLWQGAIKTQDLIEAVRMLDGAGLLVGKVEAK